MGRAALIVASSLGGAFVGVCAANMGADREAWAYAMIGGMLGLMLAVIALFLAGVERSPRV
jgi:hypothetical protein